MKFISMLVVLISTLFLSACDPVYNNTESNTKLSPPFEHCKFIKVQHGFAELNVIHCPYTESIAISERQGKVDVRTQIIKETKKSEITKKISELEKELNDL